jgi:hypothetical protein
MQQEHFQQHHASSVQIVKLGRDEEEEEEEEET